MWRCLLAAAGVVPACRVAMETSLRCLNYLGPFPANFSGTSSQTHQLAMSLTFLGGGGGRTARKFPKGCIVLWGNREMTEKYEYCITVAGTLVHDCSHVIIMAMKWNLSTIPCVVFLLQKLPSDHSLENYPEECTPEWNQNWKAILSFIFSDFKLQCWLSNKKILFY